MFSRLDPVFKANIREAERADTRLGIREDEEREEGRKNRKEKDRQETSEPEDKATVSVAALAEFLNELISEDDISRHIPQTVPADSHAARPEAMAAASAYRKTSGQTEGNPSYQPAGDTQLSAHEKVLMARLIEDLEYLSKHGVTRLTIGKTDSGLLEGFIYAAEQAKSSL